jgi:hypothetical protein
MAAFESLRYGPIVADLLSVPRLAELGPGSPDRKRYDRLKQLTPENLVAPETVRDADMAAACLAGLWLYFDFLDESHQISQGIATPSGSYWHGIMHRREPDYDNAKYWFRRVGAHPVHEPLCRAARELAAEGNAAEGSAVAGSAAGGERDPAAGFLATQSSWDAARFVDLCRHAAKDGASCEPLCRQIQQREWQLLFDDCYRRAVRG